MNKSNRIGLAVVTYTDNYGSHLQAFATQEAIRKLGYETEIINIDSVRKEVSQNRKKYFLSRIFDFKEVISYKNLFRGIFERKINKKYAKEFNDRHNAFSKFAEDNYIVGPLQNSWKGLHDSCKKRYESVVVGSDQLWRPANIEGDFYTLNFVPDEINKVSYATSFGMSHLEKKQADLAIKFLSRIQHLSVREEDGAKLIKDLTGRKAEVVCDPTLLLTEEEWLQFVPKEPIIKNHYILMYLLGTSKEHRAFVKRLSIETGYKIVGILHGAWFVSGDENFVDINIPAAGPLEFLNLIKNADYVCTDSFHGCVFSIIFNKTFFPFKRFSDDDPMSTNNRLSTLHKKLGIDDRLVEKKGKYENINFQEVNKRLALLRKDSFEFLKESLTRDK